MRISARLGCVLIVATAATAAAQSLGDVARAEQERRKSAGKATKVYTNENLRPEPQPSQASTPSPLGGLAVLSGLSTPPGSSTAPGASAGGSAAVAAQSATATSAASSTPNTETGWRTRAAELRGHVVRQQILADALQSRVNALLTDFVNRDDPAQRAVIEADRLKALAELERVKLDLKGAQQAVVDLEDQARRLNVPPGWLR